MAVDNIIYPRIRELREEANLTQADVAKLLNCTQASYSYYEIGKREIPTQALIILAKYYDTSIDYMLGLSKNKAPYRQ